MQRLDLGFFAGKQTGELMSILNNVHESKLSCANQNRRFW